jgi:hypothetical protein
MRRTNYRDLAEFDLPFATPEDPMFGELVLEIQNRPSSFGPRPTGDLKAAAVLLNHSAKAIVVLAYTYHFTTADGRTPISHHSNLGSSMQLDVLAGRSGVSRDQTNFILPNSKRLISQEGIFGDNLDVLPPELARPSGSFVGSGGHVARESGRKEIAGIELRLDIVFFDDGLCVGPDDLGLSESVTSDLELQRNTAQQIVEALRKGASVGQVFEILRPLARRTAPQVAAGRPSAYPSHLRSMFANMAINQLVNVADPELLLWFEGGATVIHSTASTVVRLIGYSPPDFEETANRFRSLLFFTDIFVL